MYRTYVCAALCFAWSVALIQCQWITGGPVNRIVVSSGDVELSCNRSASVDIRWTFRPLGSDHEQDIPGQYREISSNYGVNSLVLENVQLSSAGTYVCRSTGSDALKPAGAYLVVIAQKPCCHIDEVDSAQAAVTCSVTYAGQMDAELSLLAKGNGTITSRNLTAQSVTSTDAVSTLVLASSVQQTQYSCRVSFFSAHSHVDVANNHPGFVEGNCHLPFQRAPVYTDNGSDLHSQTTNASSGGTLLDATLDGTGNSVAIYICLTVIAILLLVIGVMALYFVRHRMLSCPCWQSAGRRRPAIFCSDIAADHTNHCEADDKRPSHVQVSQDDVPNDTEPTSPTENVQLISIDVPQRDNGEVITVGHTSASV